MKDRDDAPWIQWIDENDADEHLRALYASGPQPLNHIVKIHSLLPDALQALLHFYRHVMHGPIPLSMVERETIAVTVSVLNGCHY